MEEMDNKLITFVNDIGLPNVCLLCLEMKENLLEVFGPKGVELDIASILKEHFWFEFNSSSPTEVTNMCEKCWEKVESFDNFYNFVKSNHQGKCFDEMKVTNDQKQIVLSECVVKVEPLPEIDSTDIANKIDYSRLTEVEEENADSNDAIDEKKSIQRRQSKRKSTISSTETSSKKYKSDDYSKLLSQYFKMCCDLCDTLLASYQETNQHYKDYHDLEKGYLVCCSKKFYRLQNMLQHYEWHKNPTSFKCNDCPKNFSDKYRLRDHVNFCHTPEIDKMFSCDKCDKTFSKRHLLSAHQKKCHNSNAATSSATDEKQTGRKPRVNFEKENEMIRNRFIMQCDLCSEPYTMFRDAQLHHLKVHNQAGYLYCCDRKFFKMYKAVQHCVWHDDPESFKCSFCQKCLTDKISLRDHIRNVHDPQDERQFQCDVCKKTFAKIYLLRSHMKVNHIKDEDKKFECHICSRRFVILSFLKSHINRVHRNVHSHICELCELYISAHTDISQKVQCDMCGKWLKNKCSLKKHMLWHNSETATCGQCGRVSSNIRALRAHIRSAHREASWECTVCKKMFKKKQVLKEHMAIHAGITDLYSCFFCSKTFRSNSNMYAHRKRAHPVELERKKAEGPSGR